MSLAFAGLFSWQNMDQLFIDIYFYVLKHNMEIHQTLWQKMKGRLLGTYYFYIFGIVKFSFLPLGARRNVELYHPKIVTISIGKNKSISKTNERFRSKYGKKIYKRYYKRK